MHSNTSSIAEGQKADEMKSLKNDIRKIEQALIRKQERFDSAHAITREMIRDCAKAITMLHNNDFSGAMSRIEAAKEGSAKLRPMEKEFAYVVEQAYQELAEAMILYSIKKTKSIPTPSAIGIQGEPFILGLMDVVGELKREMLIAMRSNDAKDAKLCLSFIEKIYDSTRSIRFAESILPSFRKKQDVARIQLENASSDMLRFLKG